MSIHSKPCVLRQRSNKKEQTKAKRLRDWKKVLKDTYDWDYYHLLVIWIHSLRRMRDYVRDHGHHANDKSFIKQLERTMALLERVEVDDYGGTYKVADRAKQRDLDKALKLISKHLFTWWD